MFNVFQQPDFTNGFAPSLSPLLSNFGNVQSRQNMPGMTYSMVHGLDAVKNFTVFPGSSAVLFDDEKSEFYIKTVDKVGVQNLRKFEYKEVSLPSGGAPGIRDDAEVENLKQRIATLEGILTGLNVKNPVQSTDQKENIANQNSSKSGKK